MPKSCKFRSAAFTLVFLVCFQGEVSLGQEQPEVTISQGTLLGNAATSRDGRPFYEFLGVPYGKVDQPFETPLPADGWNGTRLAIDYTTGCLRFDFATLNIAGTQDCLHLDIYTPKIPSDSNFQEPLPVIVYLIGGGFTDGWTSLYSGAFFMDEDVVLVLPNYRLGPYGFLNMGIEEARGNQGLKDQVLALKWVRDNIDKFGGDPTKVTIVGESAGATSVSLHTVSSMSKGLFSGAIIQSGGAACPVTFTPNPGVKFAKELAAAVDCPTRDAKDLVECLKSKDPLEVLSTVIYSLPWPAFTDETGILFGPTFETFTSGEDDSDVFLSEDPFALMERGEFERVPIIIGQMSHESYYGASAMFVNASDYEEFNKKFGRILPTLLYYQDTADDPCVITSSIRDYFFNGENITSEDFYTLESFLTDRIHTHCLRKMGAEYSKFTSVYMYNFTHQNSLMPDHPPSHGDELMYLFLIGPPYDIYPPILPGDAEYEMSKNLIRTWAAFARDGRPGLLWGSSAGIEWNPLVPGQPQEWLQIDDEPYQSQVDVIFENRWRFWDSLPLKEYGRT